MSDLNWHDVNDIAIELYDKASRMTAFFQTNFERKQEAG